MKTILTLLSLLLLMISCNDGSDLGANYYYLAEYEAEDIGYPYGSIVYKSKKKNHFDEILIFSDIKKINYNNKYVIVLQKTNKKLMLKRIKDHVNTKSTNKQFDFNNSLLEKENYYILDKINNKLWGPLNYNEFIKFKSQKKINLNFDK